MKAKERWIFIWWSLYEYF